MGSKTALCGLNVTAADFHQVIGPLIALCFKNENTRALTVAGDSTKSVDEVLLEKIGRYAGDGSYIEMTDQDDSLYRWVFTNGSAQKIRPLLAWPEPVAN